MNVLEEIKTYEDVCKIEGVDPITSLPYPEPKNTEEIAINAFAKITRVARVLNDGWQPDWNNDDEYKYYPWFDMEADDKSVSSPAGFSFYDYLYAYSHAAVGSRLCYKTRALAEHAGTEFLSTYREFMVIEK